MSKFSFVLYLILIGLLLTLAYLAWNGNEIAIFFSGWLTGIITIAIGYGLSLAQSVIATKAEERRFDKNMRENAMITLANQRTMNYQNAALIKENSGLRKALPDGNSGSNEGLIWDDKIFLGEVSEQ